MDLAFVMLFACLGAGAIIYAGLHVPPRKSEPENEPVEVPSDGADKTDGTGS